MDPNQRVQKEIDKIYEHLNDEVSLDNLNEDIGRLNERIAEVKVPSETIRENIQLLKLQILNYESQFEGDLELEMIQDFKS